MGYAYRSMCERRCLFSCLYIYIYIYIFEENAIKSDCM